jgi:hypothetical protein
MRFGFKGNLATLFFLAILLSSVACSELPELTQLLDNPSNDFTPPSCLTEEASTVVAAQVTATARVSRVAQPQKSSDTVQQRSLIRSSRDLLLLCSILRT